MPARDRRRDRATRLARLPVPTDWIVLAVNGGLLVFFLGLAVTLLPAVSTAELQIDVLAGSLRSPALDALALGVSVALSPPAAIAIIATLFCYQLFVARAPVNGVAVCLVISVGWLSTQVVKLLVSRPRPPADLLTDPLLAKLGTDSFPSGHTAFATAFTIGLMLLARRRGLVGALGAVLVFVVGFTRVYGGVHYPSDVVGGMLTALTASLTTAGIWNAVGLRLLRQVPGLGRIGPLAPLSNNYPDVHRTTLERLRHSAPTL